MNKTRIIENKPAQTYPLTWINENADEFINGALVSEWILADEYTGGFLNPFWNGSKWIETATQEEIDSLSSLSLIKNETELYRKRQCDGVYAYAEISAEFRLAKLSGVISEEQHSAIESALIPVRNEVLAGQWISAINILEQIGNSIGQELYDRLHNQLTNYINFNY